MEDINMAYEECFKLSMLEGKTRTIRDWFHEKFPIFFSFFRKIRKGNLDTHKHSLTVDSSLRMFTNIVMDYTDITEASDVRNKHPETELYGYFLQSV